MKIEGLTIIKLPHDGLQIQNKGTYIYFDPFQLKKSYSKANYVLITHSHHDHCSVEDIQKLVSNETIIITTPDCVSKLSNLTVKDIKPVTPGDKIEFEEFSVEAVPAYNTDKQFHPKEQDWVGFIVTINGKRVYHAGDTDHIPEMKTFGHIDIAFLPVSGTYVMTAEEAAHAYNDIKPKVAVPMHYGSIVGSKTDAEKFCELVKGKTIILEEE